jgi:tRNA modification GTPase
MSDTIAAIATGNIVSAIGIIRVSGDDAIDVAERVFTPSKGGRLSERGDRQLIFGDLRASDGCVIDRCMCTISRAPHSYTGENTAEFHCHGSPVVLGLALESLFFYGARQALAGEFTKRAFLNGKMDLTQAEAVIDLIESDTAHAAKNAAGQLRGAIFRRVDEIYSELVDIMSHYHAVLDYPDEDIDEFDILKYKAVFCSAQSKLSALLQTYNHGKVMKSGVLTTIVGRPNAGKSSLLNALLGYDRAIVTEIAGTTRDTIEEALVFGGIKLRITDTAGLRSTTDKIEKIGVDRAIDAAKHADLAVAVFDGSSELTAEDREAIVAAKYAEKAIAVINKIDLPQLIDSDVIEENFDRICRISALNRTGLDILETSVAELFPAISTPAGEILTNARQADAIARALESLQAAERSIDSSCTPDIILTETENALNALGELTGKTVRDEVTARIFERFCVGK